MFQATITNFNLNINALNEKNSFSAGDLMTGYISFDLTNKTKITSVAMALTGKANVHWSTGGGGKKNRRKHYSANLDFFNFKSVIVQENSAVGGTHLQPGRDFPSTFCGVYGKILYTFTVSIHRPWHLAKDFVTELNFVNHINTCQPELQAPLSGSNNMTLRCLWCASGHIFMTASVEKKAFIPGETVKIVCEFSNTSSQTATPKVVLQQKQVLHTINRNNTKMISINLASVTGRPIRAHTSGIHTRILLAIPITAPLTISNCSIIKMDYFIKVSLCVRASHNLTVLVPIILCDTAVFAQPPLDL